MSEEYFLLVDESGNLGFDFQKTKTTRYFLLTLLASKEKRALEKCVKRVHRWLQERGGRKVGALHAYDEEDTTRRKFFSLLVQKDCEIFAVLVDKPKYRLRGNKLVLYEQVLLVLLERFFVAKGVLQGHLILSRPGTGKALRERLESSLRKLAVERGNSLTISIKSPEEEKALQAVDFVSWAIFRKYEYGKEEYYAMIEKKIKNTIFVP